MASLISFGAVALNDLAVSWGTDGVNRVILESLEDIAYGRLKTHKSFSTDRLSVNVKQVVGKRLIGPVITFHSGSGEASVIRADAAELRADPAAGAVSIKLFNVHGGLQGWAITHPGEFERSFPLQEFLGNGASRSRSPAGAACG